MPVSTSPNSNPKAISRRTLCHALVFSLLSLGILPGCGQLAPSPKSESGAKREASIGDDKMKAEVYQDADIIWKILQPQKEPSDSTIINIRVTQGTEVITISPDSAIPYTKPDGTQVVARPKIVTLSYPVTTTSGKKMVVNTVLLSDLAKWTLGSTVLVDDAVNGGSYRVVNFVKKLTKTGTFDRPIIALGVASHEHSGGKGNSGIHEEEKRGQERADNLAAACRDIFPKSQIFTCNLGIHDSNGRTTAESGDERRVVLMYVDSEEALTGAELEEGVLTAIPNTKGLFIDVNTYSLWRRGAKVELRHNPQ